MPNIPSMLSLPFLVQNQGNTNLPPPPPPQPHRPASGQRKPSINGPYLLSPAHKSEPVKAIEHTFGQTESSKEMGGSSGHSTSSYSVTCILFSGIIFVAAVFIGIACLVNAVHRVQEGNIAVYFKNGALLREIGDPGIHMSTPFVTTVLQVTIRPETRYLNALKCTTSDGVVNIFREIQVISSLNKDKIFDLILSFGNDIKQVLVYDRISEGIQSFCANNSIDEVYNTKFIEIEESVKASLNSSIAKFAHNSITIWNLFIPKPEIPPAIAANYREVKIEWTKQLVAQQKQKTEKIKKETILQNAVLDAERDKAIGQINNQQTLQKKENEKNVSTIENEIRKRKEDTNADIESYMAASRAEYNKNLLTDQYIKLQMSKALISNTKVFFSGENSAYGGILNNLFKLDGNGK